MSRRSEEEAPPTPTDSPSFLASSENDGPSDLKPLTAPMSSSRLDFEDASEAASPAVPASASPLTMGGVPYDDSSGDDAYNKHWEKLKRFTAQECETSAIALEYGCESIRHHRGPRGWAAIIGGDSSSVLGMFDTKEESIKRALCAAMVMDEFDETGRATAVDVDSGVVALNGGSVPSKASKRKGKSGGGGHPEKTKKRTRTGSTSSLDKLGSGKKSKVRKDRSGSVSVTLAAAEDGVDAKTSHNQEESPPSNVNLAESDIGSTTGDEFGTAATGKPKKSRRERGDFSGRPRACQMSDSKTGAVLDTFRSCSEAERVTRISRAWIGKACRDGGGAVNGVYFKFVTIEPPVAESDMVDDSSSVDVTAAPERIPVPALERSPSIPIPIPVPPVTVAVPDPPTAPPTVEKVPPLLPLPSPQATPDPPSTPKEEHKLKSPPQTEEKKPSPPPTETSQETNITIPSPVPPKIKTNPKPPPEAPLSSTPEASPKTPLPSTASTLVSPPPATTSQPPPEGESTFDLTTLKPLTPKQKPPKRPKKLIEMIDPKTGLVIVNFRGNLDAGKALMLERKTIIAACMSYGKEDEISFPGFKLRYGARNAPSSAYEYGKHKQDFKYATETLPQRLDRWKTTFQADNELQERQSLEEKERLLKMGITGAPLFPIAGKKDSLPGKDEKRSPHRIFVGEEFPLGILNTTSLMDPATPITLRDSPLSANSFPQICIVCQTNSAQIVLEPCQHCVLCVDCCDKGFCNKFCPCCRMPIVSRVKPTVARLIRPRIYSAYSFM